MPKSLNIQDIMEMLPHRFPFLLIDRVVELSDELDRVVAIKNVTMNEPQFTGHFPQAPVMPGSHCGGDGPGLCHHCAFPHSRRSAQKEPLLFCRH